MADYFDIGVIVKPQGLNGALRVFPVTDDPERFSLLDEVIVFLKDGKSAVYGVESAKMHQRLVILTLSGIKDRTAAEKLTGAIIKIPPDKALPLEDDEYYIRDLLGLSVWTDEGEALGVVREVLRTGANDIYAVETPGGSEILIPAVKQFVLSVSVPEQKIIVHLLEGMRE